MIDAMQKGDYAVISLILVAAGVLTYRQSGLSPSRSGSPSARVAAGSDRAHSSPPPVEEGGITVYFSPNGGCQAAVVAQIGAARHSLDMQAYTFTSSEIAQAVAEAHDRGVAVRVILDRKENETGKYSVGKYLTDHGIATYDDGEHPIAHNKIIIVDGSTILTGSFNFTHQAEHENAENLLIIKGKPALAKAYEENFELHLEHSASVH